MSKVRKKSDLIGKIIRGEKNDGSSHRVYLEFQLYFMYFTSEKHVARYWCLYFVFCTENMWQNIQPLTYWPAYPTNSR